MDNLPKDPTDQNNNSVPPAFGSDFTPHTNPIDPNNPYQSQPPQTPTSEPLNHPNPPNISNTPDVPENPDALKHEHYSEAAQNKPRDEHGHFIHPQSSQTPPTFQTAPNTPNYPSLPNSSALPALYSGLTWELTQSKTLLFTSGKRRIEQDGVYLESAQVADFPQEFVNYYTQQLTNASFKQTFNSSDPNGTTITFAKDELFLTFGVKNIYSGSGETKKLIGYKAFIEHN